MSVIKSLQRHAQIVRLLVLVISVIISSGLLLHNRGLNFAFYHETYVVKLPADADFSLLDAYGNYPGISAVDRADGALRLQGPDAATQASSLAIAIGGQVEGDVDVSREIPIIPSDLLLRFINLTVIGAFLYIVIFYLFVWRHLTRVQQRNRILLIAISGGGLVWGLIIYLGILSGLSLIAEVGNASFLGLIVMIGVASTLLLFELLTPAKRIETRGELLTKLFTRYNFMLAAVVFILIIGLGPKFVLDGALLLVGFWLALASQQLMTSVWVDLRDSRTKRTAPVSNMEVKKTKQNRNTSVRRKPGKHKPVGKKTKKS